MGCWNQSGIYMTSKDKQLGYLWDTAALLSWEVTASSLVFKLLSKTFPGMNKICMWIDVYYFAQQKLPYLYIF